MTEVPPILGEIIEPEFDTGSSSETGTAVFESFREAMRRLAGGIGVVTVDQPAFGPIGITATSITSLSMSPPSLLVSIGAGSSLMASLREAGAFTVHLLGEGQEHEADVFAGRIETKRRDQLVAWDGPENNASRLAGAIAHVDCRLARLIRIYTHTIAIGVVIKVRLGKKIGPLVHFDGVYRALRDDGR